MNQLLRDFLRNLAIAAAFAGAFTGFVTAGIYAFALFGPIGVLPVLVIALAASWTYLGF